MTLASSIYLINPASDFPSYFTAEIFAAKGFKPATYVADLAIPTVAGMVPPDFHILMCDESLSPIDFTAPVDFVGITGKVSQWNRMRLIAREFRRRGRIVIIGGPFASLSPDVVRPHCDILVRGEIEEIYEEFFSDLRNRHWKTEYIGTKPDLTRTTMPRWDLYPNDRAILGTVQTTRGCPFECEFCDVIEYLGRKQRRKPNDQVLKELDELYRHGYRNVILCDDNFTAQRGRSKELLEALRDWNLRQDDGRVSFITQASIDAAKDDEMLQMSAAAGLTTIFVGIETPNEDSLRETKKYQNTKVDLSGQVQKFLDHGIQVVAGMICGFDSDGPDIFERQRDFALATPIPIFTLGALVAPAATPLHDRLAKEGRLLTEGSEAQGAWNTNIIPRQMTREQLLDGVKWLFNEIYHPTAFGDRVLRFMDSLGTRRDPQYADGKGGRSISNLPHPVNRDILVLTAQIERLGGPLEREMWKRATKEAANKPAAVGFVMGMMWHYMQIRYMYEMGQFWEPHTTTESAPAPVTVQPVRMVLAATKATA